MKTPLLSRMSPGRRMGLGGAALLALGVAGGAGAVSLSRPTIEMAPTVQTPVARLSASSGVVTVRGQVAAVYGDRFLVQDGTGRVLVDGGRAGARLAAGSPILVQGRYDDGQLRARYLVDRSGTVQEVGPPPPPPGGPRPGGPGTPPPPQGAGAPPPPPGGPGAPPPPGGPGAPRPAGAGAPPPPPGMAPAPAPTAPGATPSPVTPGQVPPPPAPAAPAA